MSVQIQDFLTNAAQVAIGSLMGRQQAQADLAAQQQQQQQEQLRQQQQAAMLKRQSEQDALEHWKVGYQVGATAGQQTLDEIKRLETALPGLPPDAQPKVLGRLAGLRKGYSDWLQGEIKSFQGLPGAPPGMTFPTPLSDDQSPPALPPAPAPQLQMPPLQVRGQNLPPAPNPDTQLVMPQMAMPGLKQPNVLAAGQPVPFPRPTAPPSPATAAAGTSPPAAAPSLPAQVPGTKLAYLPGVGMTAVFDPAAARDIARQVQARLRLISGLSDPQLQQQGRAAMAGLPASVTDLPSLQAANTFLSATQGLIPGGAPSAQRAATAAQGRKDKAAADARKDKAAAHRTAVSAYNSWLRALPSYRHLDAAAQREYIARGRSLAKAAGVDLAQVPTRVPTEQPKPAPKARPANPMARYQRAIGRVTSAGFQRLDPEEKQLALDELRQSAHAAGVNIPSSEMQALQQFAQQPAPVKAGRTSAKGAGPARMDPIDSKKWAQAAQILRTPAKIKGQFGAEDNPGYNVERARAALRTQINLAKKYGSDPSSLVAEYPELAPRPAPAARPPTRATAPPRATAPAIQPAEVEHVRQAINGGVFNQWMATPALQNPALRQKAKAAYRHLLGYDWQGER